MNVPVQKHTYGVVAQLGERLNGIQKVGGSIPLVSKPVLLFNQV